MLLKTYSTCEVSVLIVFLFITTGSGYIVSEPKVEILLPRGLRVSIPDKAGLTSFLFHGAINRTLEDLQIGDFYGEVLEATNGKWVYDNFDVVLYPGDVLNFWAQIKHNNDVYRMLGRSITIPGFRQENSETSHRIINSMQSDYECNQDITTTTQPPYRRDRLKVTICLVATKN